MSEDGNIQHVRERVPEILDALQKTERYRKSSSYFGDGKSAERFMKILNGDVWDFPIQKHFVDIDF